MKTIGIIGGLDFLGCDITLKFLSEDYFVKVLDLPREKHTPQLINTSIRAGENLKIFSFDLNNPTQLTLFFKCCDIVIHCGRPFKLEMKVEKDFIYVPVINDAACLIKVLSTTTTVKKIIFLTSVGVLNTQCPESDKKKNLSQGSKQLSKKEAFFHSEKIITGTLNEFPSNRLVIVQVAPVIIRNNMLKNSRDITIAGLQFLFRNKIVHDMLFQKLAGRNLMETMINADKLPDKIFSYAEDLDISVKASVLHHY